MEPIRPSSIVVEGNLTVYASEGGFAPDGVEIGDEPISDVIGRLFGIPLDSRGSLGDYLKLGPVRLTIERLDDA